ncbi:MAG: glycoside hydrolase family 25 protein [Lachnospiraceae bacterium]|nr:glycoside hydrolase family 25 protein [Lachnospiraceae bacterium]
MRNSMQRRIALILVFIAVILAVILLVRARRSAKEAEVSEETGLSGEDFSEAVVENTPAQLLPLPGILSPGNIHPAATLLNTNTQFYSYKDEGSTITTAVGIDVSEYQGSVDYKKVRDAGIQFVIIRIGYQGYETGRMVVDKTFYRNYLDAHEAGLPVGVYFFSQAVDIEEARRAAGFVLATLDGIEPELPIVYDYEVHHADTARASDLSQYSATASALAFCEVIRNAGHTPMIYMNDQAAYGKYDLDEFSNIPVWYASYVKAPELPCGFTCWQYSCTGSVSGVDGDVDLNLLFLQKENN